MDYITPQMNFLSLYQNRRDLVVASFSTEQVLSNCVELVLCDDNTIDNKAIIYVDEDEDKCFIQFNKKIHQKKLFKSCDKNAFTKYNVLDIKNYYVNYNNQTYFMIIVSILNPTTYMQEDLQFYVSQIVANGGYDKLTVDPLTGAGQLQSLYPNKLIASQNE